MLSLGGPSWTNCSLLRARANITDTHLRVCCACGGQVAIGIGQLGWAEQCFRLAVALDPNHGEALNNLGVLESRKGQLQQVSGLGGGNVSVETGTHLASARRVCFLVW